jgi:hypothetical protein
MGGKKSASLGSWGMVQLLFEVAEQLLKSVKVGNQDCDFWLGLL